LLAHPKIEVNRKNLRGGTPLHGYFRKLEILALLLADERVDVNMENDSGDTAFMSMCASGYLKEVKMMLADERVWVNALDKQGLSSFFKCCAQHKKSMVELLLTNPRIDPNFATTRGRTALHDACADDPEIAKLLLADERVSVNTRDHDGVTPFETASFSPFFEIKRTRFLCFWVIPRSISMPTLLPISHPSSLPVSSRRMTFAGNC